eukprot:gene9449-10438_t
MAERHVHVFYFADFLLTFIDLRPSFTHNNHRFSFVTNFFEQAGEFGPMFFYAVRIGRQTGIFKSWRKCREQVKGYKGAKCKKFKTIDEALNFISHNKKDKKSKIPTLCCNAAVREASSTIPVVYADGACLNNGIGTKARAGIGVFWGVGDHRNVSERLTGPQTSERAELNAVIKALETAVKSGMSEVELRTDSMDTINCATDSMNRWKKNGWKTICNQPVKNIMDLQKLDCLCNKINVKWVHVRGHQGIFGNEEADRLSKLGAALELSAKTVVPNVTPAVPMQPIPVIDLTGDKNER